MAIRTPSTPLLEGRVDRGAQRLDACYPGWYEEIDTSTLNIASGDKCICGQLYGDYVTGLAALGLHQGRESSEHGFVGFAQLLTTTWCEAIEARKTAASQPEEVGEIVTIGI